MTEGQRYRDAVTCLLAVGRFWEALQADDDEEVRAVVLPAVVKRTAPAGHAVASAFREAMGLPLELLDRIGPSLTVRALDDGTYLVKSVILHSMSGEIIDKPTLRRVWAWRVVPVDGRWQLWGSISDRESLPRTVEYVEVDPADLEGWAGDAQNP